LFIEEQFNGNLASLGVIADSRCVAMGPHEFIES